MRGRTRRSKGPEENTGADAGSSYSVGAVRTDTRDMRAQERISINCGHMRRSKGVLDWTKDNSRQQESNIIETRSIVY